MFVQGGAQVDECAVFFVECTEFGLKGREEPSLKRLPKDVYGLKGFVGNFLPYAGKTRIINSVTLGSARGACSWPQKNLTPSANADRGFARTSTFKWSLRFSTISGKYGESRYKGEVSWWPFIMSE